MTDFAIEGAEYDYDEERIKMTESLSSTLPTANLKWVHVSQIDPDRQQQVKIPVYLNKLRRTLLFSIEIPTYGTPQHIWY